MMCQIHVERVLWLVPSSHPVEIRFTLARYERHERASTHRRASEGMDIDRRIDGKPIVIVKQLYCLEYTPILCCSRAHHVFEKSKHRGNC